MKRLLFLVTIFVLASTVSAQEFGQNKVHYKDFKWRYIQSRHFNVYFTHRGYDLAQFVAVEAESSLASISASFHYQINKRINIAIFNSHNDFQQNNIVQEYLEEGTGGVTELYKNRVVLPWEGSLSLMRHVTHHELVHAVFDEMFYGGSIQSIIERNITFQLPTWFNEGMAEYQSLSHWEVASDEFLIDATVNGYMPPIEYLNGYLDYRGGESVWHYIDERYGGEKIGEIVHAVLATRSVNRGFQRAIGLNVDQLSEKWLKYNRKVYFPEVGERESLDKFARRVTDHQKDGSFYNSTPVISPHGDKIAFITNRSGYFDIDLMSTVTGRLIRVLVKGNRTANFEELHLLTPGIAWSPDGKEVAVASKTGEYDKIFMINVNTGETKELPDLQFDGINGIDFSPDGKEIAFSAYKPLQSDIYIYNLGTHEVRNLTNDIFTDQAPHWSVDGKKIFFDSDRGDSLYQKGNPLDVAHWAAGNPLDIFSIDVATGKIERITRTNFPNIPNTVPHGGDNSYPLPTPDGKGLIFVSSRNGISNLYYKNFETDKEVPLTNSLYGIEDPSLSRDGQKLAFAALNYGGYDVFTIDLPLDHKMNGPLVPTTYVKDFFAKREVASKTSTNNTKNLTSLYGASTASDFSHLVFAPEYGSENNKPKVSPFLLKGNVDSLGNFIPFPYKIDFTPDIIAGGAGFNTLYGFQGATELAFSDMLGNNQIAIYTDFVIDLKNSDYALSYQNLASKINYGVSFLHTAAFLYLYDDLTGNYEINRFQSLIGELSMSRPFDRFNRLDFNFAYLGISRQNIDNPADLGSSANALLSSMSYVSDNTLAGYFAPVNGTRYNLTLTYVPKIASSFLGFVTGQFDYRTYLPFFDVNTFAFRAAGAASVGANPQKFFIGGMSNWINTNYSTVNIPISSVADYAFLTPVFPLRGYDFNAQLGTKYFLTNMEVRFPLVRYFVPGLIPILLSNIEGVIFVDAGSAFTSVSQYKPFRRDASGQTVTQDLLVGSGFGARVPFLYFVLRLDYAWQYNIEGFHYPKFYFSLGGDF
ncbi:MAG: biopolymer transporter Tol [Bacteroidetes bacterium]|nr:biopolymer transporter Tol [Bacteroidota bacterium]MCL5738996.1 biopolymer transporter Tol [Bacteroidota bacterium]